ncbi:restriction endonuclease fold toxin-2 domain-containing protein [Streptomyces sp. NPDC059874]|uniref:restriction endonuclease fold toxin-2 domain-containing protein n=1 Tax=Streptomyces sp. NPDC059874 TaxID=3346983 RepID=UPI0036626581
MNSLTPGGFAGGGGPSDPDNAYQLRTSGYPEREVPLAGKNRGLMVDGIRPVDGYLVEAKHVRDPDCKKKSFRSLDRLEETLTKPVKVDSQGKIAWDPVIDSMYAGDEKELVRYKQAMENPANSEIRGLEIVTNGKGNAGAWRMDRRDCVDAQARLCLHHSDRCDRQRSRCLRAVAPGLLRACTPLVWFASSLAVANGEQDPWPLPAEGGDEDIAAELRRHLDSVETP